MLSSISVNAAAEGMLSDLKVDPSVQMWACALALHSRAVRAHRCPQHLWLMDVVGWLVRACAREAACFLGAEVVRLQLRWCIEYVGSVPDLLRFFVVVRRAGVLKKFFTRLGMWGLLWSGRRASAMEKFLPQRSLLFRMGMLMFWKVALTLDVLVLVIASALRAVRWVREAWFLLIFMCAMLSSPGIVGGGLLL